MCSYTDDEISNFTTDPCVPKIPVEGDDSSESDGSESIMEFVSKVNSGMY